MRCQQLNVLSIILSGYEPTQEPFQPTDSTSSAWAQTSKFSLPFPKAISIITLIFPIIASVLIPLGARLFQTQQFGFGLPNVSAYLMSLLPVVLIVLSSVFGVPTSLLSCSLESQWAHLFRIKDDRAIRAIQDTLRCCGLNSMRDRAWPFPSNGVDAGACERTQGWNVRCLEPWRRQESTVAGMVWLANLSSWALVVSCNKTPQINCIANHYRFYLPISFKYDNRGCNQCILGFWVVIALIDYLAV
jgi:hypothetical protein